MANSVSAQPDLYDAPAGEAPSLQGRRCGECAHVFFPPHDYGCESCGAGPEHLEPATLPATGVLGAAVAVHFDPGGRAPFTAIEVLLDAGPTINAMLNEPADAGPPPGTRVHGVLVPQSGEGNDKVELRFEPDPGGSPET